MPSNWCVIGLNDSIVANSTSSCVSPLGTGSLLTLYLGHSKPYQGRVSDSCGYSLNSSFRFSYRF